MKTLAVLVATTLAAGIIDGCARNANAAIDAGACAPSDSIGTGRAISLAMGTYTLQFVATSGSRPGSSVDGTLMLRNAPGEWRERSSSDNTYIAVGTANVQLDNVGATVPGDAASDDMLHPGVLVMQLSPDRSTLLRFGSDANRANEVRFDGSYMVARVKSAAANRFGGTWSSALGTHISSGYFCAARSGS